MSYLTLAEAAQYVQQKSGVEIEPAALLRAGVLGHVRIVGAFSGLMRNLNLHEDEDVLGLLLIPQRHLLEIETDGEAAIKGAFSLDGKTAYSPQVTRTREQLSILLSELDRIMPYVTGAAAETSGASQLSGARRIEGPDGIVGWWDYTMDADFWWKQPSVSAQEAALLLCQLNPNHDNLTPDGTQNGETGPQEYKKLLRTFEGLQLVQHAHRTLQQWIFLARSNGLKYHSWIDDYLLALDDLKSGQQGGALLPNEGADASGATPREGAPIELAPVQRTAAQNSAILAELKKQGIDQLALPKNEPGKPGVRSAVWKVLESKKDIFVSKKVFETAWQRLRDDGDLADA